MGSEGYLINQFIAEHTNQRHDEWGGCYENRIRLPIEIVKRIRTKVTVIDYSHASIDYSHQGDRQHNVPQSLMVLSQPTLSAITKLVSSQRLERISS